MPRGFETLQGTNVRGGKLSLVTVAQPPGEKGDTAYRVVEMGVHT